MTFVTVYHYHRKEDKFQMVASVNVPDDLGDCVDSQLETAYYLTQNKRGSWSRGPIYEDGGVNEDYSENVTVLAPLHVVDGVTYGLRSSSVGDKFVIGNKTYFCDVVGFSERSSERA